MTKKLNNLFFLWTIAFFTAIPATSILVNGQLAGNTDVNVSQMAGYQAECSIAKNPTNKLQLFASCNNSGPGIFAARSTNGGVTWTFPDAVDKTIADGDAGQGPTACCDPTLAWDTFGNLYVTYLGSGFTIETLLSTDGGATFTNLATFPGSNDQPTVVAENTTDPTAPVAVWIVWNQSGSMRARGAAVTGLGTANITPFNPLQNIPGTANCSFGDVAIAPSGVVVQTCEILGADGEAASQILVNIDADGLGPGNFGAAITATNTNVGAFDSIPAQASRTVDAEPGLAFDRNQFGDPTLPGGLPSPHFGRLYLVYTDETVDENDDTDIMLRFSDDNGTTWSNPAIRVNDDATTRSQFLPRIASNPLSGNIAICWHDARNSATNTAMQEFCAIANRELFPAFIGPNINVQISDGASTSSANPNQFSDYSGLTYVQGLAHPAWGDTSTTAEFEGFTDRVTGGVAANEGDPHIRTVDGTNYDFQSAGEFTVLKDGNWMEIQTRQTPVSTTSTLGPNGHTGLTTCVSLNTAVATRVGKRRVTYQPSLTGQADPSGMQLRIDGDLTTLGPGGINLGAGGRVARAGDGIQIDFADGTTLIATPLFWTTYGVWYLNVNVYQTSAVMGVMGAITPGTWLPRLPDRSSLGPKPASLNQRYVDLYQKFADAWRVTKSTSLFDYAPGTSTDSFTIPGWPMQNAQCVIPEKPPVQSINAKIAQELCRPIADKNREANCIFDVTVTGERGFAKLYLTTDRLEAGLTRITVDSSKIRTKLTEVVTFVATVSKLLPGRRGVPIGSVQFFVKGERVATVKLDARGRASWRTTTLPYGEHHVSAVFVPDAKSRFVTSSSDGLQQVIY